MTAKIFIKEKTINSKDLGALNKDIDDTKKGTKLIQQLSGKSTSNMSTDEIMKLTRGIGINILD